MNWEMVQTALNYFVLGAVVGYFGQPVWNILKKIWYEAKVARNEWQNPRS
jgi:hypothetical protein